YHDVTPTAVSVVSGSGQAGFVSEPFDEPLVALVVDRTGEPVADVPVTFSVLPGPHGYTGSFLGGDISAEATTGDAGTATSPPLVAGPTDGAWTVTASIDGGATPAE